jgi:hypothetical protein
MFANVSPFRAAVRERTAKTFETAQNQLYDELTNTFQAESSAIQTRLQQAIRSAKTARDYRVPLYVYNAVTWVKSYAEAKAELGDEFGARYEHLKGLIEDRDYETRVNNIPVHKLMKPLKFQQKLGAFFGDHFTVSLQVTKVNAANSDYTAVQQTLYLNYWVDKLPITILRAREVLTEPPTPIVVDTSVPWCRVEGGQPVWYNL